MKNFMFAALILSVQTGFAQDPEIREWFARERMYDVLHYKLNLQFDEKTATCEGDAVIRLVPLRPQTRDIRLDAARLDVSRIRLGRENLSFDTQAETLVVHLDRFYGTADTLELWISYSVHDPEKGLTFILPDSATPGRQAQIWSQGQPEENHYWFPCYDYPNDRATSELIATVNDRFTVVGNGTLVGVKRDGRKKTATFHWRQSLPVPSYLISMVAGEYVEMRDTMGLVPISNYVYKSQADIAHISFGKTRKMMDFFADRTGVPYPWDRYSQTVVQDFKFSGMENVSAATLTDQTMHDERAHMDESSDGLVAHELAHQWWGDYLSYRDWSQAWLSEGFSTYFEILFVAYDRGKDEAAKRLYDAGRDVVTSDLLEMRRPTVTRRYAKPGDLFDNRVYGKGAWILDMMRFSMGDELFFNAIRYYARKHALQSVETGDFKIAIEEATGQNLHRFFDQWVYGAGYPDLDVSTSWSQNSRSVRLTVRQVQKVDSLTGYFTAPVDVEVWVNGAPTVHRITISQAEESFEFPAYQEPQLVIFDKGNHLLKRILEHKSVDEWIFQLKHASDGIDRYIAVEELRWVVDSPPVSAALLYAALEDRFWEVRRNAVLSLADAKAPATGDSLTTAYGDRDARVRSAVLTAMRNFRGEALLPVFQHAFEKDQSYAVAAGALAGIVALDSANAKAWCLRGLERDSYKDGIRVAALRGLAAIRDDEALGVLESYAGPGHSRALRAESISLMGRNWKDREDVIDAIAARLSDPLPRIQIAAINALLHTGNARAMGPLQSLSKTSKNALIARAAREAFDHLKESSE
jgi:aminopeptidase N